jgi:chaperonin GroES|tara:strand:- start:387 stop:830 length:444 start_codon:yes stop_codon:yes gene_type:complete
MKMKEQSLNSTPKISIPDTSLVGLKKSEPEKEVTEESTKLPMPTGWRLLILPFKMKDKTKGGIIMNDTTLEKQQVGSQCGNVLAVGPEAYKGKRFENSGPWCKKGDWVMFARYAGSRIKIQGGEIRLLNDDEVLATIENPEDILHEY